MFSDFLNSFLYRNKHHIFYLMILLNIDFDWSAIDIFFKFQANLMKNSNPSSNESDSSRKIPQMEKLTDKTTRMLLSVLLLFLVVELPQGVLTLLSAIHGKNFFEWVSRVIPMEVLLRRRCCVWCSTEAVTLHNPSTSVATWRW